MTTPARIGLLVGNEWSFSPAFTESLLARAPHTSLELVRLAGTALDTPLPYHLILDRFSPQVPYYRAYLKAAALQGVIVVNDPFLSSADDKFFGALVARQHGIAAPRSVILPNHSYAPEIVHRDSLSNLAYPLDWQALAESVGGFPCVLKDIHGGNWHNFFIVRNLDELLWRYDDSGTLTMMLQEYIRWEDYARCYVLGPKQRT
ncbi:MAG: hypothetical protein HC915_01045 [Anaerolineae bacterium]|nr:hypothetical protein [Anaerolineae bacterium]